MSVIEQRPAGAQLAGHEQEEARPAARAVLAVVALVAIVAGVPMLLLALGAALPLDVAHLGVGALLRPDDGGLLLALLLGLAWAAWSVMVGSVLIEVVAAVRRAPTPRMPGLAGPQRLAAALVGAVVLGGSISPVGSAVAAEPLSAAVARVVEDRPDPLTGTAADHTEQEVVASVAATGSRLEGERSRGVENGAGAAGQLPVITTQRHDTLWLLAEHHLGSGERFDEIVALNEGSPQPDGRSLGPDGRVYPGWQLQLPADAVVTTDRPVRHAVERGDTLWGIAAEELGDPYRYPEIFAANRGDRQPDGGRLEDPDLIRTGWILEIPVAAEADGSHAGATAGEPSAAAGAAAEGDDAGVAVGGDVGSRVSDATGSEAGVSEAGVSDAGGSQAAESDPTETDPTETDPTEADPTETDPTGTEGTGTEGTGTDASGSVPRLPGEDRAGAVLLVPPLDRAALHPDKGSEVTPESESGPPWGSPDGDPDEQGTSLPLLDRAAARQGAAPSPPTAPSLAPAGRAMLDPGSAAPQAQPAAVLADAGLVLPAGGTLTALLLAGIAGELNRRRRQFQRHRRPGERMPAPSPDATEFEATARDAIAELPSVRWEDAVRALARECRGAGVPVPRVRVLEVGPDGRSGSVTIHLAEPAEAIRPFRAVDARVWELDPAWAPSGAVPSRDHEPSTQSDELDDPFPDLVVVGTAEGRTVHVNLAEVGTLRVAGTPDRQPDVLRALVAEVCFGRVGPRATRTLCLADPSITGALEAGDAVVEQEPVRVATTLVAVMDARLACDGTDEVDPIEIVIADRRVPVDVVPGSGAALITTAPVEGAGAVLALDSGAGAVLLPEGIQIVPQALPAASAAALVGLLAATDLPKEPIEELVEESFREPAEGRAEEPRRAPAEESVEQGCQDRVGQAPGERERGTAPQPIPGPRLAAAPPASADRLGGLAQERMAQERREPSAGSAAIQSAPRVLVLGEVRVEGATGRAESARVGRLAETAAFVLLNPDARPSALQSALWPGLRSNPQTCRQMISRTRTWLGRTEAGESYLMPFTETGGRLRLRQEVDSDWAWFQELAGIGLPDPDDTEHLTAALRLVRGRPFGPVAGRELPWADLHINEMLSLITDVAHELARRHEARGDWSAARDAALRGLRTECESEVLEAVLARVGHRV